MHAFTNMSLGKKITLVALFGILLIAGIFLFKKNSVAPQQTSDGVGNIDLSTISTTTHMGGYTIEPVPVEETNIPKPDYITAISVNASVAADVRAAIQAQQADVITMLSKNPKDIDTWIRFATLNKIAGDYSRSIEVLLYITKVWPKDPVAYGGLGDVYRTQGKVTQAKASYTTAVSVAEAAGQKDLAATYRTELNSL